jgi:hypothetical protein
MARPRPMGFVVKRQKPFQGKEWLVYGYEGEKRKQYWFFTEDDAKADAADRNREREAYGSKVNLDAEARLEAFRGADKLKPHKKTISDAVQYYLDHLEKISASALRRSRCQSSKGV